MADLHERLRTLLFLVPYVVRHRGVPIEDLTRRLGISEQELMKEIDFLLMVGRPPFLPNDMIDIYHEGGRVFVDLHQSLENPPGLTVFEALALATAARMFTDQESMGEAAVAVKVAVDKIVASLPDDARGLFNDLAGHFMLLLGESENKFLSTLKQAIDERLEVELQYYSASRGEATNRTVRPYGLHHHMGLWYLAAYCTTRKAERVFRLSRITQAGLTERIFDPPAGFDVVSFIKKSLTVPDRGESEVVISFEPAVARWVREHWGDDYVERTPSGGVIARLHDISDEYVLSYVASFGGQAKIEAPKELQIKLKEQARTALEAYASGV
jgi:proteasome accessory factor C